jgi:hypothetical protein
MSFITFAKNDILRELGKNREDDVYYDELIDSLIKYFRSEYPTIKDMCGFGGQMTKIEEMVPEIVLVYDKCGKKTVITQAFNWLSSGDEHFCDNCHIKTCFVCGLEDDLKVSKNVYGRYVCRPLYNDCAIKYYRSLGRVVFAFKDLEIILHDDNKLSIGYDGKLYDLLSGGAIDKSQLTEFLKELLEQ